MASAQSSVRSIAVAAGVSAAALLTAAAAALPAAADSHGNDNGNGSASTSSHGNSATAPGHTKSASGAASSSQTSDGHNPPGNNGTVFIHDVADDHNPHNVPHVSCNFWVDFFNFDTSQSVTVSFAGQAPTGKGTPLAGTTTTTLEADDASGAGNDWDGELAFTGDQFGVSNLGAPAHQGYHVKMTVTTNQPGDHKYKVFWIQPCGAVAGSSTQPTAVGGESTSNGSSTSSANSSSTNTSSSTTTMATNAGTSASTTTGEATGGAVVPEAASRASSGMPTQVLGEKFTRGGSTPAAGATASSLPFTGAEIGAMSLAAAVALGGGVLLTVAGRRRRRVGAN